MASPTLLRRELVRVCRRLYERGLIHGLAGNVSVRTEYDTILVTPAGQAKVDVSEDRLVEMSMDGSVQRGGVPSTEVGMHLSVYRARREVQAVVHAHPAAATGLAVAGQGISEDILPEVTTQIGGVPLVPYARSGTQELADAVARYASEHDAVLLANHGAVTLGASLEQAFNRMESLEYAARTIIFALQAGGICRLSNDEVQALRSIRMGH